MAFVLIAKTRGDELIPSSKSVVATSEDQASLETLKEKRKQERDEYLIDNPIPWWAEYGIIEEETIEEVSTV